MLRLLTSTTLLLATTVATARSPHSAASTIVDNPAQKNPDKPQVSTAETDETGFGGFVTMLLVCFS